MRRKPSGSGPPSPPTAGAAVPAKPASSSEANPFAALVQQPTPAATSYTQQPVVRSDLLGSLDGTIDHIVTFVMSDSLASTNTVLAPNARAFVVYKCTVLVHMQFTL